MEWTKENVLEKLKSHPQFEELTNDWTGKFVLNYDIEENIILLSNTVGGIAESFIMLPINDRTLPNVREFACMAKQVLQELINENK